MSIRGLWKMKMVSHYIKHAIATTVRQVLENSTMPAGLVESYVAELYKDRPWRVRITNEAQVLKKQNVLSVKS